MLPTDTKTRVAVIDDHPCLVRGLRQLIETETDLEICGTAGTIAAGVAMARTVRPDILIADITLPDGSFLGSIQKVLADSPQMRIVVFTFHSDRTYLQRAMQLKVGGFILKSSEPSAILHALRSVRTGGIYVDPVMVGRAVASRSIQVDPIQIVGDFEDPLSDRELDTLRMTAFGYSIKEISQELGVSPKSVETYKFRATSKLGLFNRANIVRYAVARGWFESAADSPVA